MRLWSHIDGVESLTNTTWQKWLYVKLFGNPPQHTHTHTHSHTHTCTHTHAHAHTHTHALTRMHTHIRAHTHARTHTRARTHAHSHAHTRTRAHTCTHVHTRTQARTHTHARTHMRTHTHTHACTHTHTHTHAHTHSRQETEQTHSSPSSIKLKERIRILVKSFNLLSQNSNLYWNSKSDDDDFLKRFQNKKQDFFRMTHFKVCFFFPLWRTTPIKLTLPLTHSLSWKRFMLIRASSLGLSISSYH